MRMHCIMRVGRLHCRELASHKGVMASVGKSERWLVPLDQHQVTPSTLNTPVSLLPARS